MVLKNYRTLATTQVWDGTSQTIITSLPRDFLSQRYIIDMFSDDVRCTGTSVLVTDAFLKCIDNIKIVAVGEGSSRTIWETNGKDLYHMNEFDYGSAVEPLVVNTTTGAGTCHTGFVIDLRCDKTNPDDYSVSLPTYLLSSLQLEITYLAPSAVTYGTNFPTSFNTDVTTTITCIEGIPESNEDFSSNPLMTVLTKQLTADTSTGTLEDFDTFFQVGALITRDFVCFETSAGVRSDTECDNLQVKSGTIPIMSNILYRANKSKDIQNYRINEIFDGNYNVNGYTMIDFNNPRAPFIQTAGGLKIGGLSTVGYNTGDLIFSGNFSNASSIVRRLQTTIEG